MYFPSLIIILLKSLIKLTNVFSSIYTQISLFFPRDPTIIFIKNRTLAQINILEEVALSDLKKNIKFEAQQPKKMLWVIIPFRDQWHVTEPCLKSLLDQTLGNFSLGCILIDNDSKEQETLEGIKKFAALAQSKNIDFHVIKTPGPFNFSAFNNSAVKLCLSDNDWILFLNNDIELIDPDSINSMLSFATLHESKIGALGCTLIYPSRRIQHLFAAPGVKIVAAHPGKGWPLKTSQQWFQTPQPVAAVTGAALMCSARRFRKVGGFDERLPTLGQDIDLCLKFQKMNLTNWVLPQIVMIHAEGATKSSDFQTAEIRYIYQKWGRFLTDNPFYAARFSRWSETPVYRICPAPYPWEMLLPKRETSLKRAKS